MCAVLEVVTRLEAPGRFELPTRGLGNRCSVHLSYGATKCILLEAALKPARLCAWQCWRATIADPDAPEISPDLHSG